MPLLLRSLLGLVAAVLLLAPAPGHGAFAAALLLASPPGRGAHLNFGDLAFWKAIANSKDPAEYRAYLEAYPRGLFAPLARIRANERATPKALPAPPRAGDAIEIAFWKSVENATNPAELAAYLAAYPKGQFATLARLRLAALSARGKAAMDTRSPSVTLESESARATSLRFVEDIASVVNKSGERTALPVIGGGSLRNLADLRHHPSVDMAIVQSDALEAAKAQGRAQGITYIAKLYNEELHLLARRNIRTITNLANKKVDVDVSGGGTEVTAARLFRLLKIPVVTLHEPPAQALAELKKGEIAALALVTVKPSPFFRNLGRKDGLHFLPIALNPALTRAFIPSRLTASDYPGLVPANRPVDTVAVGTVLAVADLSPGSARYRAVANFVGRFFNNFDRLLDASHDPRWRKINLAAGLPGWRRFPAASRWLDRHTKVSALSRKALQATFSRFIDAHGEASGAPPMPAKEKSKLFREFQDWEQGHRH